MRLNQLCVPRAWHRRRQISCADKGGKPGQPAPQPTNHLARLCSHSSAVDPIYQTPPDANHYCHRCVRGLSLSTCSQTQILTHIAVLYFVLMHPGMCDSLCVLTPTILTTEITHSHTVGRTGAIFDILM